MHEVVLVSGPPCAGKSTFVQHHAAEVDDVLDFDLIARELGSKRKWSHTPSCMREADRLIRARMRVVALSGPSRPTWVVRTLPDGHTRKVVAEYLGATRRVLVLPPEDVLMDRATRRPSPDETRASIRRWLAEYSPEAGDEVISDAVARA